MSKFIFLKSLRELLTPLKRLIDRKAENVNWNENDPSSNSYIANRTHYKEKKEVFYLNNSKLFFENAWSNIYFSSVPMLNANVGDVFTITWDGIEYKCKVILFEDTLAIGNISIVTGEGAGTGEPFLLAFTPNEFGEIYTLDAAESHTVSCYSITTITHKIPSEYLPEISSVGKEGTGDGAEIFNDYENNIASGNCSHAEGTDTSATEYSAHAEGYGSEANGWVSHAEGYYTSANGEASHSEGYETIAQSRYQHVQGQYNLEDNSNKYAHIVGNGSYSQRSNAHTLDWNGLGWFAGGLKIGGTGQDDANAVSVATLTDIYSAKNNILFIDQVNGYTYIACMREGNFVTYCAVKSIEVTTMPTKTEYMVGDYLDPTGMVVTATTYDGTTKEITDFTCPSSYIAEGDTSVKITYEEAGIIHATTIPITVIAFDAATVLVDFEYTTNEDGTYTITGWKGTLNGEASTEMIIPNNGLIVVQEVKQYDELQKI